MEKQTEQFNITLTPVLLKRIKEQAESLGISTAAFFRMAVLKELKSK